MNGDNVNDRELDKLLAMAARPVVPRGAEARLMAAIDGASRNTVVAFRPRQVPARSKLPWLTAIPLAASLAFGLWLGLAGVGNSLLPSSLGGDSVASVDLDFPTGIDEAEAMVEDNRT